MKRFIVAVTIITSVAALHAQSTVVDVSKIPLNQDNPSVCINRINKNLIVIGAASDYADMDDNGMLAFTSTDRGASWSSSRLPMPVNPDFYIYGEPSLACDDAGTFYYAYITNDGINTGGTVSITSSTDGKVWKNVTPINNNLIDSGYPDGVHITIDNSTESPHHGRIYAIWNQYFSDDLLFTEQGVTIAWSDDKGKKWSTPKFLGTSDDYQEVKTGKHGEIYVSCSDTGGLGHELFVSTDGGSSFNTTPELISYGFFENYPWLSGGTFTGLKGLQGFAAYPYISIDVDLKTNRIHAVFGDFQDSVAVQAYSYSDDNGAHWSSYELVGISISDAITADRFDPWVTVDQKTGETYVTYFSSELDTKNILTAPYRVRLRDSLKQMMNGPFDPMIVEKTINNAPYIGDHTSCDAFDSVFVGAWTQNRSGFSDADVFAYVSLENSSKSGVGSPIVIHSSKPWLSAPYPNPSDGKSISLRYYIPHPTHFTIDLLEVSGKTVKHLLDKDIQEGSYTDEFVLGNIPTGSYIIRMQSEGSVIDQKLIITVK